MSEVDSPLFIAVAFLGYATGHDDDSLFTGRQTIGSMDVLIEVGTGW